MPFASRFVALVRHLFRRERRDRELDQELSGYLDLLIAEKTRSGLSPGDAERAARIELGGVTQVRENVREARAGSWLDTLFRDVRFAFRSLRKTPSFTLAAVAALGLGIGANTAILSVVNAVLLRPLPYADADRLAVILHDGRNPVAPANFLDWRKQTRSFTDMAAAEFWTPNLTGGSNPEHLSGLHVTSGLFQLLGVPPLLGRTFGPSDDVEGNDRVIVLGHGLWQRRFGGDPSIVGRQIPLDGVPYTVVGVMPPSFRFAPFWATRAELWAPLVFGERTTSRTSNSLRVFARLRTGTTLPQARTDLGALTSRLERENPGTNRGVTLTPLKQKVVGDIQTPLLVLLVAVTFVLLIACANVAHMLLARASSRSSELAVRTALGATRARIVAQLLVESSLLAAAGGLVGVMLAYWGVHMLVAANPAIIPQVSSVSIDSRVLFMTLALTGLTALMFGLVPALRSARVDLASAFRDGGRGSSDGQKRGRLRSVLVASEFSLALILLVGAGLMIRSVAALRRVDPGFDPRNVVTLSISTAGTDEGTPERRSAFFAQVLERTTSIPGVASASFINHLPITGDQWGFPIRIEGRPKPAPGDAPFGTYRVVFPGYFRTMGIPLLRGRDFEPSDRVGAEHVAIINEFMAKKNWPNEDPIGKRFAFDDSSWVRIIAVAKNTVRSDWSASPDAEFFVPFLQQHTYLESSSGHFAAMTLVVRVSCAGRRVCDASATAPPLVKMIRSIDPSMPISEVSTMASIVEHATSESRFYLILLMSFAGVALTLAAVGIYGVMSYSVSRRRHEIGIRIALGADPAAVLRLVVRQGMHVALAGAGVGLGGAFLLTRLMNRLLFGVTPSDPLTFGAVTTLLCLVALVASYVPAVRATRIDPLNTLRST
jgi:putative ABC transport system permease protein